MNDVVDPPASPARTRSGSDIGVTITLVVLTVIAWFVGAGVSLLGMIFFSGCNRNGCGNDSLITGGVVLIVLGSLGIIASIVMLVIKRRAWPVALITFGVIAIGWIVLNLVDFG